MSKFCIFTALYLPNLGGVERYTFNLAKKLQAAGNEVTIVTSNMFSLPETEMQDGMKIVRIPCWNLLNGRFPVLKPNAAFRRINKELSKQAYDFVIVQTRFYVHSLYGARYMKKHKLPGFLIEHGTGHFTVNHPLWDRLGEIYEHVISWLVRMNCPDVYGVSQNCCQWSEHFHFKPCGILYNSIDQNEIARLIQNSTGSFQEKYNLEGKSIITYTGRLVKEKGILKLVKAVSLLQRKGIDAHLLIAGEGEMRKEIECQNLEYVHLLGKLSFSQVVALLNETDVFCLPTDYPEGFPTSVLEAAACKCYVVTTDKGGSRELILDESYGTILKQNEPDRIAEAIEKAILEPEHREEAVERTYQRLNTYFTWDYTTEKVMQIEENKRIGINMQ